MFYVRLVGGHLYGKQLSLDVLDGIWDLIESVSGGFLTYSYFRNSLVRVITYFSVSK